MVLVNNGPESVRSVIQAFQVISNAYFPDNTG